MPVAVETVAVTYLEVVADVAVDVPIPCLSEQDVRVFYGRAGLEMVRNVDFTVEIAGTFETFTVTPTSSLRAKIDALIAEDDTEADAIVVRRDLDFLTSTTAAKVRSTPFTSAEFERTIMRLQQLDEKVGRAILMSPTNVGTENGVGIGQLIDGRVLVVEGSGANVSVTSSEMTVADLAAIATSAAASAALAAESAALIASVAGTVVTEPTFPSRLAAEAASIPVEVTNIRVIASDGTVLSYRRRSGLTTPAALPAVLGDDFYPAGVPHPDHWADNKIPGSSTMQGATKNALLYAAEVSESGENYVEFLPNCNYAFGGWVALAGGDRINLNGSTITLVAPADRAFLGNGNNVVLEDGKADCASLGSFYTGTGYRSGLTTKNVEIVDPLARGFALTDVSNVLVEDVKVSFTAAGVLARVASGVSFYGSLHLASLSGVPMENVVYRRFEVDMSNFTAAQMGDDDACLIVRGNEVTSLDAREVGVEDCKFVMPRGELGVTYGTGLPRPTGVEVRQAVGVEIEDTYTEGGDLTITFGSVDRLKIKGCHSQNQTNYGIEIAQGCGEVAISDTTVVSELSEHPVSITGGRRVKATNCDFSGGKGAGSGVVVVQNATGPSHLALVNSRVSPRVNDVDGVRLVNGGTLSAIGTEFTSAVSGAAGHVHVVTGTSARVILSANEFEGPATRPVKLGAGATLSLLHATSNTGVGTPLASDLATGTVTASVLANNHNLTNL